MEKEILLELKELRLAITKVGTSNKQSSEQFSTEALDKAAKEFLKLSTERGEWIAERDIEKVIKSAGWRSGKFIREQLKFYNFYKRGQEYFYNKEDLQKLNKELKDRNIDLSRYIEYMEDEVKFKSYLEKAKENKKGKKLPYEISDDHRDINTSAAKPPTRDVIKADIKNLKREFRLQGLDDYVDVYRDRHAMMKHVYFFDKYIAPEIKSRCTKWIRNFNYAHDALENVKKHEKERANIQTEKALLSDNDN